MSQDMISALIWILGGAVGVVGILIGVLWNITRAEQQVQDENIEILKKEKADRSFVLDTHSRHDKEFDRMRDEYVRLQDKSDEKHQRELAAMESRLSSQMGDLQRTVLSSNNNTNDLIKELIREMTK
jgi:hypothetical protein